MKASPTDVYLAHTPSHIVLSLNSVVARTDSSPALLVVYEDFLLHGKFESSLGDLPGADLTVVRLPGRYRYFRSEDDDGIRSFPAKAAANLVAIWGLQKFKLLTRELQLGQVHVFNDVRSEVQAAMAHLAKMGARKFVYMDEGFAAYRRMPVQKRHGIVKLLYGGEWRSLRSYGTHPLISDAFLFHPKMAHADLAGLRIHPMPPPKLSIDQIRQVIKALAGSDSALERVLHLNGRFVMVCLPHSSLLGAKRALLGEVRKVIEIRKDRGDLVLVKAHPREREEELADALAGSNVIFVDRTVPAELILLTLGARISMVCSGASSILLTASWAAPDVPVFLFAAAASQVPPELMPVLQVSGVQMWT